MSHPALAAFEYHLLGYYRTWRASVFSSFLLPALTVIGFGLSVGHYITTGVDGVSYLDWVVPGLLAANTVNVAIGESSFPVFSRFEWSRTFHGQVASPLRVLDILSGLLVYVVFRVLLSCTAFLIVMIVCGTVHSPWALVTVPLVALTALAVSSPVLAFVATVTRDHFLAMMFRFVVIPMGLFAGVFFPVESLPVGLRALAYATPLWHGVELCRAATLGVSPQWPAAVHLLYLAVWAVAGFLLALDRFRRRLID